MEKLYNTDSYIKEFYGKVLSCTKCEEGYRILLDKTAFFPEQGGQYGDKGKIGDVEVFDTQLIEGEVYHYTKAPLNAEEEYFCTLNWSDRFRKMQNHTAEHIFSGIANRLFGCENTGFHLDNTVTLDLDKLLKAEELEIIEKKVNEVIWANKRIKAYFPDDRELLSIPYRSKKEVYDEGVRIVEIEDTDFCACCAPHLRQTGEAGVFKILSFMKHKGGTRIFMAAGMDAFNDYLIKSKNATVVSQLLSVPDTDTARGVKSLKDMCDRLKKEICEKNNLIAQSYVEALEYKEGNYCVLFDEMNKNALINLVNLGKEKCSGMFALCYYASDTLNYIIGSSFFDMGQRAKAINSALKGRGGGRGEMIQGSFGVAFEDVKNFFERNDI